MQGVLWSRSKRKYGERSCRQISDQLKTFLIFLDLNPTFWTVFSKSFHPFLVQCYISSLHFHSHIYLNYIDNSFTIATKFWNPSEDYIWAKLDCIDIFLASLPFDFILVQWHRNLQKTSSPFSISFAQSFCNSQI